MVPVPVTMIYYILLLDWISFILFYFFKLREQYINVKFLIYHSANLLERGIKSSSSPTHFFLRHHTCVYQSAVRPHFLLSISTDFIVRTHEKGKSLQYSYNTRFSTSGPFFLEVWGLVIALYYIKTSTTPY